MEKLLGKGEGSGKGEFPYFRLPLPEPFANGVMFKEVLGVLPVSLVFFWLAGVGVVTAWSTITISSSLAELSCSDYNNDLQKQH